MAPHANFGTTALTTGMDDKVPAVNDVDTKALGRLSGIITDAGTFSDADATVTDAEATENGFFDFDGTITADRTITFPTARPGFYWVRNSTTGAFALRVEVSGGTADAIVLPRDSWIGLLHDGTNFAEISRNAIVLTVAGTDITTAGEAASGEAVSPVEGNIRRIDSVVQSALTSGPAVVDCEVNGTAITGGTVTIASGAAKGDRDTTGDIEDGQANANTVAIGDRIEMQSDGGPSAGEATFFIYIEPRIV